MPECLCTLVYQTVNSKRVKDYDEIFQPKKSTKTQTEYMYERLHSQKDRELICYNC